MTLWLKIVSDYILLIMLLGVIVFVVREYGLFNNLRKVLNS